MRVAASLHYFWYFRGHYNEGRTLRAARGDAARARASLAEALISHRAVGDVGQLPHMMYTLAGLDAVAGRLEDAVRLASAAANVEQRMGIQVWPVVRRDRNAWLGPARRALGDERFARHWEKRAARANAYKATRRRHTRLRQRAEQEVARASATFTAPDTRDPFHRWQFTPTTGSRLRRFQSCRTSSRVPATVPNWRPSGGRWSPPNPLHCPPTTHDLGRAGGLMLVGDVVGRSW
jgi:hypothetical protein